MFEHRIIGRAAAALLMAALAAPAAWAQESDRDRERAERRKRIEAAAERRELEEELRNARREFQAAARKLQELQAKIVAEQAEARAADMARAFTRGRRGRLGVVVDTTPEASPSPDGALVVAVTPGTPAEEAGLRPGDVIVGMNGEDLTGVAGGVSAGRSAPALELIRRARGLKPGDRVELEYVRDGRSKAVDLEAGPAEATRLNFVISPQVEVPAFQYEIWPYALLESDPPDEETLRKWREFELVELNPDLGKYFGSGKGVLVVRAPDKAPLDVKAGDVIIGIDGSETDTPLEAFQTLRSVKPGEPIEIKLLRNRNVMVLRAEAPHLPWTVHVEPRKGKDD